MIPTPNAREYLQECVHDCVSAHGCVYVRDCVSVRVYERARAHDRGCGSVRVVFV